MRLKRVKIFGFKTFADRTEFNLDGGVIAVVGPNGCGKSNLVDAILWGLGEGNSRHLRAQTSQDVIFSGTPRRKGVGFAEVNLLFDNEDGSLPIDTPEVSITRRLTRGGDTEYSINRQSCRLRDIYDLLADSGLGRAGYAIVGQKEIDAALSASAEDRRGWIDEAAGVQRYRVRKVESQRRLAQAQEHLSRVTDILTELEAQREPLADEAEVAIRYKNIIGSLREVEIGLLVDEVAKAVREVGQLEKHLEESAKLMRDELARADNLEAESKRTGSKISELEQEMDDIRDRQQASLTSLERAGSNLKLLQQRLLNLDEQEKSLAEDTEETASHISDTEAELAGILEEEERESKDLDALRKELSGAGSEADSLRKTLIQVERELDEARRRNSQRLRAEAENTHRLERKKLADRELAGIEASLPDLREAIAEAQKSYDELSEVNNSLTESIRQFEAKLLEVRREEEADAQSVRKSMSEKASLEGRRRGIEATIEAHEGLTQGSRAVVEAAERGILSAEYTPVGSAIEVDRDFALAIETALGGSINDLIVDDQQDAKTAIEWLKQHRAGRATFQPIPLMRPSEVHHELRRILGERGVVGRASELIQCRGKHRPVIDSLLGRVVIVEDIDVALKLARTQGWARMVTLEGEVVHSSGAVTGGQQSKQGYGMVQRKADLGDIARELDRLDKVINEYDKRSATRRRLSQEAEAGIADQRQRIQGDLTELKESRAYLQTLSDELKTTERSRDRLLHELEQLNKPASADLEPVNLEEVEAKRDVAIKALAAKSADAEQAEARLREAEQRLAQAQARSYAGKRRLQIAKETELQRKNRLLNLEPERAKIRAEMVTVEQHRAESELAKLAAETKLQESQTTKRGLLERSLELSEDAKAARSNATAIGDATHQAELNRSRAETRRVASLQRLMEEYGISEEDALEQEGTHEIPPDAQTVVNRLRREIRSMGDVNVGAIDAYMRLTTRLEELTAQRDDVLAGIEQVQGSIGELDKLTRDRFVNTFTAVQESFSQMFLKLFSGGEGRIVLTDEQHVLESGIDLEITLPGKKRQPLALLSGGERALCASAFLFALLSVKPSPLVVLDEVDAPMDGTNVERFAKLLHEFTDRSQFIVITHNPTTIQSALVWLGVTMQEPGISTLLPTKLPPIPTAEPQLEPVAV